MNDERHDEKHPRGSSPSRPAASHHAGNEKQTPRVEHDKHNPAGSRSPDRRPGGRPKYVAPPRVEYAPSKLLGIASYTSPEAPKESSRLVSMLLDIVEEASPLPASRRKDIRRDVLDLWRELTSEKSTRQPDYIGEPAKLAAYLRYFLPWNVVRLVPLLAKLDLGLAAGDRIIDIGSGPLTMPIALWIARPELRGVELHIYCVDRVRRVMEIGATILEGLALRSGQPFAWKVTVKKESFSMAETFERERYSLVTAANVFNESFWRIKGSLTERADMLGASLGAYTTTGGRILIVEPGDPRSGAMLASLRESVILNGGRPLAPCPHSAACPMAGAFLSGAFRKDEESDEKQSAWPSLERVVTARGRSKAPWCHFVIDPGAAPQRLVDFSEQAGLPKDRLIASWLLLQPEPPADAMPASPPDHSVRIISDAFRLPDGGSGRYACTQTGYSLVRDSLADLPSGALAVLDAPLPPSASERDEKSNAVLIRAHSDAIVHVPVPYKAPRAEGSGHDKHSHDRRDGAPSGDRKPSDHPRHDHSEGRGRRSERIEDTRKPPILPRGDARRTDDKKKKVNTLGERSPYARSKKPWGPHKPKRSS